ncbi:MAG: hypothetical protein ACFBSF_17555 [Leptolyngbyaceae cyanobacterium]
MAHSLVLLELDGYRLEDSIFLRGVVAFINYEQVQADGSTPWA